jgi:hypothetical protein
VKNGVLNYQGCKRISVYIVRMRFYDIIYAVYALAQSPVGKYCGSKSVFGENINGIVTFTSPESLDFEISGDFEIICYDEYYTQSGNQIILPDIDLVGNCVHDALVANKVTLNTITYDITTNTIDVSVKYSIAKLDIHLEPCIDLM